jgi:hypothetical protein
MLNLRAPVSLVLAAFLCLFVGSAPVKGNLLPFLSNVTSSAANPGDDTFCYSVSLSNDERIDASGTGNPAFFTIYDFQGYVANSIVAPADWAPSVQYLGITPVGITVPDDPSIVNLTFTYTGPITIDGTGQTFTGFSADSIYSSLNSNSYFSQQSTKNAGAAAGGRDAGLGPESVPLSNVPEPAMAVLLAMGLALMAGIARRGLLRPKSLAN